MIELNKIYNEDCLVTLSKIDNNSIDCVVTSPPYFNLRNYKIDGQIGIEETPQLYIDKLVDVFFEVYRVLKPTGTLWVNLGDSYNGSGGNHKEHHKNDTGFQGGVGAKYGGKGANVQGLKRKDLIGIPWVFAFAMRDRVGFYLRQDIIWEKGNPMPEPVKDRCVKSHEYIFLFSKSEKYYFDYQAIQEPSVTFIDKEPQEITQIRFGGKKYGDSDDPHHATKSGKEWKPQMKNLIDDGQKPNTMHLRRAEGMQDIQYAVRNKRDVWHVNTEPSNLEHCAMFPTKLITPCILAGCPENGIVYDPFGGAATTALTTLRCGGNRKFILSELNPEYVKIGEKRILPELQQLKLF